MRYQFNDDNQSSTQGTGGSLTSVNGTMVVNITAMNDAPTAVITPASYSVTEQIAQSLAGTVSIGDVDSGSGTVTATLAVTTDTYGGILTVTAGTTGVTVATSGTQSVTLTGTVAQINALLAGNNGATVAYLANTDRPIASTTLTLSVDDGGNTGGAGTQTASDTATINITPVNDTPTVTLPASIAAIPENTLDFISGISIADPDSGSAAETATTTLTLGVSHGNLRFFVTSSGTASVLSGNNSGTVVLQGKVADINALLALSNNFSYTGVSNFSGTETLTALVQDQGNVGTVVTNLTDTKTLTFTVSGLNNPPVLTAPVLADPTPWPRAGGLFNQVQGGADDRGLLVQRHV